MNRGMMVGIKMVTLKHDDDDKREMFDDIRNISKMWNNCFLVLGYLPRQGLLGLSGDAPSANLRCQMPEAHLRIT